jgi:hypothetical protein
LLLGLAAPISIYTPAEIESATRRVSRFALEQALVWDWAIPETGKIYSEYRLCHLA